MNRQFNGALPCTAIIDVIGDYELPAGLYYDPAIRRCSVLAGNAVMIGNDLFSARKEAMTQLSVFNFPRLLAADKDCSVDEAMAMSAEAYRQAVNAFRKTQLQLFTDASPELKRLSGAWIHGLPAPSNGTSTHRGV